MFKEKPLVLVILGPTASGKSALAVKLAKKFNGEVISADSRQVYRGMDLGTGKITEKEMAGIPHHLLDVADPRRQFSASRYQKLAAKKLAGIIKRGKLPIICGGTGFYIHTIVDGLILPAVPPNPQLRAKLEKKSVEELFEILQKLNPARAEKIDRHNPRRLIRAIEIAKSGAGSSFNFAFPDADRAKLGLLPAEHYDFLQLGINLPMEILEKKIHVRLLARVKQGMIEEVAKLHQNGLSWKKLEAFGLEYKFIAQFLKKNWRDFRGASEPISRWVKREKITPVFDNIEIASRQYAKRQMTWFKRDQRIHWIQNYAEALKILKAQKL